MPGLCPYATWQLWAIWSPSLPARQAPLTVTRLLRLLFYRNRANDQALLWLIEA